MTTPDPAQVLEQLADYIDAANAHYKAHYNGTERGGNLEHVMGCKRDELEMLDPALIRAQAAALAEREAEVERLRALADRWQFTAAQLELGHAVRERDGSLAWGGNADKISHAMYLRCAADIRTALTPTQEAQ